MADQSNLSQPGVTHYAHLITTGTPGFSDLPTALGVRFQLQLQYRFGSIVDYFFCVCVSFAAAARHLFPIN